MLRQFHGSMRLQRGLIIVSIATPTSDRGWRRTASYLNNERLKEPASRLRPRSASAQGTARRLDRWSAWSQAVGHEFVIAGGQDPPESEPAA